MVSLTMYILTINIQLVVVRSVHGFNKSWDTFRFKMKHNQIHIHSVHEIMLKPDCQDTDRLKHFNIICVTWVKTVFNWFIDSVDAFLHMYGSHI